MNELNVKIGNYDVYARGSVITFGNNPIVFEIFGIEISIIFEEDPNIAERFRKETEGINLKLKLYNFTSGLISGTTKPIDIGMVGEKTISILFFVQSLNKGESRIFTYTWLLK